MNWRYSYKVTCFLCGTRYATIELFSALSVPWLYHTNLLATKREEAGSNTFTEILRVVGGDEKEVSNLR
jgi:hypothetical protein